MRRITIISLLLWTAIFAAQVLIAADKQRPPRARPPKFTSDSVRSIFFGDIFREALVGRRPVFSGSRLLPTASPGVNDPNNSPPKTTASQQHAWSKVISESSLQDEIKRIKQAVDRDISTPQRFKGGDYQKVRQHFSVLAMLFAITGEYDRSTRWQEVAPRARDLFAKAGYNCKAGTDQSFQEAKRRKADLQEIISGGRLQTDKQADRKANWEKVCDRAPLMKQIDEAQKEALLPWMSDLRTMTKNRQQIIQQAELIAAVAEAMKQEGMEDADDDDYRALCDTLKDAARGVVEAVQKDNLKQARQALRRMTISCDDCHEDYRG